MISFHVFSYTFIGCKWFATYFTIDSNGEFVNSFLVLDQSKLISKTGVANFACKLPQSFVKISNM